MLALMTARVPLPIDLYGQLPAGPRDVDFTVGHLDGARTIALVTAGLSMSTDAVHFVGVPVVTLGHSRFRARLFTPRLPAGSGISLRISATDKAGGSITKTVTNAYTVCES